MYPLDGDDDADMVHHAYLIGKWKDYYEMGENYVTERTGPGQGVVECDVMTMDHYVVHRKVLQDLNDEREDLRDSFCDDVMPQSSDEEFRTMKVEYDALV